jgi:hypothetical protein
VWSAISTLREALDVDGHGRGLPYKLCDVILGRGTKLILKPVVELEKGVILRDTKKRGPHEAALLASLGSSGRGRLRISSLVVNPDVPQTAPSPAFRASSARVRPDLARAVTSLVRAFVPGFASPLLL